MYENAQNKPDENDLKNVQEIFLTELKRLKEKKERIKSHHFIGDREKYVESERTFSEFFESSKNGCKDAVIYIHIPFCRKTCTFCTLRRFRTEPTENYHNLIVQEILSYSKLDYIKNSTYSAIYFGGGTPSTLSTHQFREIITAIKNNLNLFEPEITVETSVTDLSDDKLTQYIESGVNRLSVGVQTLDNEGRKILGRIGSGEYVLERLKEIKKIGFNNLCVDIIYSYPHQNEETLVKDIETVCSLDVGSFSMYSLINHKGVNILPLPREIDEKYFYKIVEIGFKNGYKFLEATKMTKYDEYRYIVNRIKGKDTLPLGAGAGGRFSSAKYFNPLNLAEYEKSVIDFHQRPIKIYSDKYFQIESLKGNIQLGNVPKIENDLLNNYIQKLKEEGCISAENRLTPKGFYWAFNISEEIINFLLKEEVNK